MLPARAPPPHASAVRRAACYGLAMSTPLYLNHAGTSWPKPEAVPRAAAATLAAPFEEHPALLADAQALVAERLGLSHPERLLFTPGCTSALWAAVLSLPLAPGDVVLTSALEHEALARPLAGLARRGVRVEVLPCAPGGVEPEDVRTRMKEGPVAWLAVSVASNVTGEVLPVPALREISREHGVPLLLDAAQSAGVLPDLRVGIEAEVVAFAGHKGPQGPQGIGGLWVAPEVDFPMPDYCDVGSANLAGACALAAGLDSLAARGPDPFAAARACRAALRAALTGRAGCRIFGGAGEHTAALSLLLDALPVSEAEAHFLRHGICIRAGRHCAGGALERLGSPDGSIRVSFGPDAQPEQVDAVVAAIDAVGGSRPG